MLRYENKGNCIEINLPNKGYSIFAIYTSSDSINGNFEISLFLKEKTIRDLRLIDTQSIISKKDEIKSNIMLIIKSMYNTKEIDNYIEKYEYELKCLETGLDFGRE